MKALKKFVIAVFLFSLAMVGHTQLSPLFGQYTGPNSLGSYILDRDMQMGLFLEAYKIKLTGKDTYCIADSEHGLYLYVRPMDDRSGRVAQILLSSFPNCRHTSIHTSSINPIFWRTDKGIGIGSTTSEVIRAYGRPVFQRKIEMKDNLGVISDPEGSRVDQARIGDLSYTYSCMLNKKQGCTTDNRSTQMGFDKGKLIWIRVSNSE